MTTLPVSGGLCHLDTGTGNETKRVPIIALMTRNSWPVSWCSRRSPDSWDLTLLPVKNFKKGPPPEKAKLKRLWTYLSQFRLTVHHIRGIKNELSDYISRNNFDALIGESSEAVAKEAFQRIDVQLALSMRTAGFLEGWSLTDSQSEYKEIL